MHVITPINGINIAPFRKNANVFSMRLKNQMKTNVIVALFHGIDNQDGKYK